MNATCSRSTSKSKTDCGTHPVPCSEVPVSASLKSLLYTVQELYMEAFFLPFIWQILCHTCQQKPGRWAVKLCTGHLFGKGLLEHSTSKAHLENKEKPRSRHINLYLLELSCKPVGLIPSPQQTQQDVMDWRCLQHFNHIHGLQQEPRT